MHHEKWWSLNPPSHLKHIIQSRNKNYIIYLFTSLTTLLVFFHSVITCCQLLPDLPHVLSTPWGSTDSFLSLPFSALKTWEWHVLTLCPESYQMLFSQRSVRLRQEMWFKDKSKNPGNISWLCKPCYTMEEHKFFGRCLAGTCSTQLLLSRMHWAPGSDDRGSKAKIVPGDFRGGWGIVQVPGPMKGRGWPSWW